MMDGPWRRRIGVYLLQPPPLCASATPLRSLSLSAQPDASSVRASPGPLPSSALPPPRAPSATPSLPQGLQLGIRNTRPRPPAVRYVHTH
ncbi:hypothetical protein C8Q79DRAFT_951902 [Trametes meyenii]|nr:hypothetical protein C8Q79DRAFT_951902 [Trametes meyenii]